jgi:hypothetical protein
MFPENVSNRRSAPDSARPLQQHTSAPAAAEAVDGASPSPTSQSGLSEIFLRVQMASADPCWNNRRCDVKTKSTLPGFMALLLCVPVVTGGLAAQGRGQGRGNSDQAARETLRSDGVTFGPVEIRIIRDWFSNSSNLKGLPPGLAKKKALPPGLQKQLRRNGALPPGLQKQIQPLPRDLEVRLPRLPEGRTRVVISGSIILYDARTSKIFDILEAVF